MRSVVQSGHVSNYYLGETIKDDEVELIQKECERLGLAVENTRVRKDKDGTLTILVASASTEVPESVAKLIGDTVKVEYGDFADALRKSADSLLEAKKYAANDHQKTMLEGYASRLVEFHGPND